MAEVRLRLSFGDLEKIILDEKGELKPEIVHGIADAFAKKYLKSVLHTEIMRLVESGLRKLAETICQEEIGRFKDEFQCSLSEKARSLIRLEAGEGVRRYIKEKSEQQGIEDKEWIEREFSHYYREYIRVVINDAANQHLGEFKKLYRDAMDKVWMERSVDYKIEDKSDENS